MYQEISFDDFQPIKENNLKWSTYSEDVLPMWVAAMDLPVFPGIFSSLNKRVNRGDFSYEYPPESLSQSLIHWMTMRYGFTPDKRHLLFVPGVVYSLNMILSLIAGKGDKAVTFTPIYPPFLKAGKASGIEITQVKLELSKGRYVMNPETFVKSLSPNTKALLLCSPHNPTGAVYSKAELEPIVQECMNRGIVIISDEIWADLVYTERSHIPLIKMFPHLSEEIITIGAPSKTFNIPGLALSYIHIQNREILERLSHLIHGAVPDVNVLSTVAATAAWSEGEEYLKKIVQYLKKNREIAISYIEKYLPGVTTTLPEATYLIWLNFEKTGISEPAKFILEKSKVALNNGKTFGEGWEHFARLNFAMSESLLLEGLERIKKSFDSKLY